MRAARISSGAASLGRVTSTALVVAGLWSLVIIVAGFTLPVYASESGSSSGVVTDGSRTIVGVNGPVAIIVVCVPLLATLLVWGTLVLRARLHTRAAAPVAWLLVGMLAVFTLMSIVSIGVAVVPVTLALVVAVRGRRAVRSDSAAAAVR